MAVQTRSIKRRLKSVRNTRKITKAMELVAASKMRKAVSSALGSRPYAKIAWETVRSISEVVDVSLHPLLMPRVGKPEKALLVLITSDRGLAGGFNSNAVKHALSEVRKAGVSSVSAVCVGRRGAEAVKRAGYPVLASFVDVTNKPTFQDILPIGKVAVEEYLAGRCDTVLIAYTDFVSALTQKPAVLELLPLVDEARKAPGGKAAGEAEAFTREASRPSDFTFEPSPQAVLDALLPRIVEAMTYQAVLESAASEHSARMMAMRSATDAASEMIDDLNFTFNQARQAGITQEIAEISSGKAALESQ
ncbi:ATP synthase F1 subunit gamma [Patescibacteria group bacterium]|nr:MAG: ATP synthase F1 subunit gamma [Patescibacteria group bacterium]